jgi:hypothetical protein
MKHRALPELPREDIWMDLVQLESWMLDGPGGTRVLDRPVKTVAEAAEAFAMLIHQVLQHHAGLLGG